MLKHLSKKEKRAKQAKKEGRRLKAPSLADGVGGGYKKPKSPRAKGL